MRSVGICGGKDRRLWDGRESIVTNTVYTDLVCGIFDRIYCRQECRKYAGGDA